MKTFVHLLLFLFISSQTFAQAPPLLDEGFNSLRVDESLANLSSKLKSIESDELWGEIYHEEYITSTHTFTLDSKNALKFFGLGVKHIDVQFKMGYIEGEDEDGDGEPDGEGEELETIFQFTLYMEAPSEKDYRELMVQLTNKYGMIETMSINEDDTESPNWFTSITMLTVSGEDSFIYHDGIKYITAKFSQAYGG